jgi:hypothetical protein
MMRRLACLVSLTMACASTGAGVGQPKDAPLVGTLRDRPKGCGCYLGVAEPARNLVFWNDGTARMNIAGVDTVLTGEQALNPNLASFGVGPAVIGARYTDRLRADDVSITIDFTVTSVCEAGAQGCDHTGVDAVITAERAGRREILTAQGACGC